MPYYPGTAPTLSGLTMTSGRQLGHAITQTSTSTVTLGNGNHFLITGATQINSISNAGWTNGSIITMRFASTPTIGDNTGGGTGIIVLAPAGNQVMTSSSTLTLRYESNAWYEITRSVR